MTITPINWSALSWRSTEAADIAAKYEIPEGILGAFKVDAFLPYSKAGARRRHESRVSDAQKWIDSCFANPDMLDGHHFYRALRAWCASMPGDIRRQWPSLPVPVAATLSQICDAICERGGTSDYGPASAAIRAVILDVAEIEHRLDVAIAADDWAAVKAITANRDLSKWAYASGYALPEKVLNPEAEIK